MMGRYHWKNITKASPIMIYDGAHSIKCVEKNRIDAFVPLGAISDPPFGSQAFIIAPLMLSLVPSCLSA